MVEGRGGADQLPKAIVRISIRTASFGLHVLQQLMVHLVEALSRSLPPGVAEALKPGHARDISTGDICTCSVHPTE